MNLDEVAKEQKLANLNEGVELNKEGDTKMPLGMTKQDFKKHKKGLEDLQSYNPDLYDKIMSWD